MEIPKLGGAFSSSTPIGSAQAKVTIEKVLQKLEIKVDVLSPENMKSFAEALSQTSDPNTVKDISMKFLPQGLPIEKKDQAAKMFQDALRPSSSLKERHITQQKDSLPGFGKMIRGGQ
jgi:hypothetical protein